MMGAAAQDVADLPDGARRPQEEPPQPSYHIGPLTESHNVVLRRARTRFAHWSQREDFSVSIDPPLPRLGNLGRFFTTRKWAHAWAVSLCADLNDHWEGRRYFEILDLTGGRRGRYRRY